MVESPKNRKGKKLVYSAPVAAIFVIAAVLGMQFGCTDETTAPGEAEQTTIKKDVYGAISGVVHDLYTNAPLKGVKVTLQGIKKAYTASTDKNGHFRIDSVYLGTVTGISGGAGFEGGDTEPQRAEFDFPLFFNMNNGSYAPWKERVALGYEYIVDNGTIVIPSGTFFEVGRTGLMPYVQGFTGTVYAGPGRTPARGVTVMLDHEDYPSSVSDWPYCQGSCPYCEDNNCEDYDDYVELVNSFAVTDDNGVFTFDLDDRVVAYSDYGFIVMPYDLPTENQPEGCVTSCEGSEDPECVECECFACAGDGIYEYDSMYTDLNLEPQPASGFDLMGYQLDGSGNPIVVQTHQFAVNLQHGSNSLEVIYCSLSNIGGGIIPVNYNNFVINVTFNYPLRAWAFRLLKDRSIPVAIRVVPTSSANISFDITPIDQLNVAGNTWRFQVYAVEDYTGNLGFDCDDDGNLGTSGFCYWDFNVAGYVPPVGPIVPRIDVNVGSSQSFSMTVPDRSAIYRLYKSFGPTSPFSVLSVMQASADLFPWLNIAFDKPVEAVGTDSDGYRYYAFLRDSAVNSAWVQQPVYVSYEDNQSVEGQVYVPSNFMSAAGGDNNWLGDNKQIHMTILPVNEDGFIDMTQLQGITAASYRVLEDLWGPMIVGENVSIYGSKGTYSADGGTLYDEAANIAFHEILNASVAPTATETSANFNVAAVFMDEKHTFVTTEFAPAVTATLAAPASQGDIVLFVDSVAGFYPGDNLALYLSSTLAVKTEGSGGPVGTLTLTGFDSTLNVLILNRPLGRDHAAGEVVAMLGPMQAGVKAGEWVNRLNQSTEATSVFIAVAPDALGNLPQAGSLLIVNDAEVQPVSSTGLPVRMAGSLLSAYPGGTSLQSAIAGYGDANGACCDDDDADVVANTVLLADAAGGSASITVEDGTDIAAGDWLVVGTRDYVKVASVTPGAGSEATVTFVAGQSLHQNYSARLTTVVELTPVTSSVTLLAYPLVSLQYGIDDLLPGSSVTITDGIAPAYTATALSAWNGDNNWIGLSDLAPDRCSGSVCSVKNFASGSDVGSNSTRTEDSIQVNVTDTSGNTSLATDKDGDGQADFDQLELWGGNVK
jgi:hypothetical protein